MSTLSATRFGKYQSSNFVVKADYVFQYILVYMHMCTPPFFTSINKYQFIKIVKRRADVPFYYMHSPTYKRGIYTKIMQIKLFTAYKSIGIALNKAIMHIKLFTA